MSLLFNVIAILKNAIHSNKKFIVVRKNKIIEKFVKIAFSYGLISGVEQKDKQLKIFPKYTKKGSSGFVKIKNFSNLQKTTFVRYNDLVKISQNIGLFLISTNSGILTNQECIEKKRR